jgi:hypothetical protein
METSPCFERKVANGLGLEVEVALLLAVPLEVA